MVFRKPYAFLIKNFKKIHILLVILWGYIFYKIFALKDFIKEFITYGTYNRNIEGISTKIGILLYVSLVLFIVISIIMLLLLKHKKKPWKLYLILILEYAVIFYNCVAISSFFNSYTVTDTVSNVYMYRDMLNITSWIQYIVLIILIMRITGLDLKKFEFNNDEEFLQLSSKDREEFEVSFEIDKHSFKRKYNQLKRNIGYFYKEHKKIVNVVFVCIIGVFIFNTYKFFMVTHKSYSQGDTYYFWYYGITVNDVYVTDKNAFGKVVEKGNKFVVVNVTIENNSDSTQEADLSRFHLMNGSINRVNTSYYEDDFKDLGTGTSKSTKLAAHSKKDFMLIYKVPEELKNKRFVLYYQEYNGYNNTYLRKIKLKVKDISKVKETKNYNYGDLIEFDLLNGNTTSVAFEGYNFSDQSSYTKYSCNGTRCDLKSNTINSKKGRKILKMTFASSDYEGQEFVDFTVRYGIINYVDSNGENKTSTIENMVTGNYEGKEIFLSVSNNVPSAKEIYLVYILREKKYIIKIK